MSFLPEVGATTGPISRSVAWRRSPRGDLGAGMPVVLDGQLKLSLERKGMPSPAPHEVAVSVSTR